MFNVALPAPHASLLISLENKPRKKIEGETIATGSFVLIGRFDWINAWIAIVRLMGRTRLWGQREEA